MEQRKKIQIAGVVLALMLVLSVGMAQAFYQSPQVPIFALQLRGIDVIPVAAPDPTPAPVTGVTHYTININQFTDQLVPTSTGMGPTTLWGYQPAISLLPTVTTQRHLGGIIVAQKGQPIQLTFNNNLPTMSPIPIDITIPGANQDKNRAAVHFHGGHVPWISDGGPFDWFTPIGTHGLSFLNNVLNPGAGINQAEYYYPMDQFSRFGWYHDHAWGITRTNAYTGVASALLIRDNYERSLVSKGLPTFLEAGGNEIPLVFQDKIFVGPNIATADPTWTGLTSPGSLWYAHTYEVAQANGAGRWVQAVPPLLSPLPDPSIIPEFFGDIMLVNGTAYPQVTVEKRRYRLRMLNACNARFLNLQLYLADNSPNGITLNRLGRPRNVDFINAAAGNTPRWKVIGSEGGLLANVESVPSNRPMQIGRNAINLVTGQADPRRINGSMIMAPAERTDVIIDFSSVPTGSSVILYNDAPSPFPAGDDRNDYFPGWNCGTGLFGVGNPVNCTTTPGFGPNTRVLMKFNVVAATGPADTPLSIVTGMSLTLGNDPLLQPRVASGIVPAGVPRRFLTLNEAFDEYGRLIQILGDAQAPGGSPYVGTASYVGPPGLNVAATQETVMNNATEVWEIYNMTADVHPMHFHLVNVQLINRQLFDPLVFPATITFTSPAFPPDPIEQGWKETVQMYPGTVTRIIQKFNVPPIVDAAGIPVNATNAFGTITQGMPPVSPRTGGNEYVWHCHILEHEEHDMMHALVVL